MRLECGDCGLTQDVDRTVYSKRVAAGLPWACRNGQCGGDLTKVGKKPRRGATDSQRRSRAQEKRVADREGGNKQPGSGAVDGYEGDVRVAHKYRGECKFTRASSFSLKLQELMKLERQAGSGELPAFDIEFQGINPHRRYVIMPEWAYEALMDAAGRRDNGE